MEIFLKIWKFFKLEIAFLGFIDNVIKMDPEKLPHVRNIRKLVCFLGLTGYYKKCVRKYASMLIY